MSKIYVYSTLSAPVRYSIYSKPEGERGIPRELQGVTIAGGANVADKHFVTPKGVMTTITSEQLELLKGVKLFQTHYENGYITYEEAPVDIEKVVSDMESRDESSPLTEQDFALNNQNAPVLNVKPEAQAIPASGHPAKAKRGRRGNK